MDPDIQGLDDLKTVQAFKDETEEVEFYQEHRDWLLELMEREIPHVKRIQQFQGMILLWRRFKEGQLVRSWDPEKRRWLYHPEQR
ncbi:MAG: hypothetical protein FVQ06_08085 [candidate division NC10 bacterium]|nr:hypothetical protein [candidate division NC10 bacterium]